jgi:hypothetical protein
MSTNATVCGNCGTENPPGRDECLRCGLPLTGSGGQELRAELAARDDDSLSRGPIGPGYAPTWPITLPPDEPPSRAGRE